MPAPKEVHSLIERFDRNREAYHSGEYNETQLRREFLDPFFMALGWDVDNELGIAEAYKDVVHEDAIKIGTVTKAPDYSFRIGGVRKFFVEAKKPSVNVRDDASPAYQLRRYAWSAKLPLSILTDFEEFAVYDCRIRPLATDKPSTNRTMYLKYSEYIEKWEDIAGVFSKDAVLKGSFDKYAGTNKAKRGTAEVDEAFLREIEEWRKILAANIAQRNANLTQRELNFAVQRTIDRIIFLRICEDRGIETYGALMALQNGEHVYKRLVEMFHRADEKYNSGLFHFRPERGRNEPPDEMTLGLKIEDKPLKDIIKSLYYPHSPYEFSVLPADILGQVYEQFLGKVIRLTEGHRAVVEDKPEVKKAGGVYYTPTYIVEYIVKNTVGRLLGDGVQGLGNGVQGFGSGVQNVGGRYGTQVVPGVRGMAEGDAPGGGSVQGLETSSAGGAIRTNQPVATGSGLDSSEHSRRLWESAQKGIPQSPLDSAGFVVGTGNTPGDSGSPQDDKHGPGGVIGGTHATSGQDVNPTHPIPNPKTLNPNPQTPTPKHVSKLRILDPACGSGSFLIGAYQYLLDWHLNWYTLEGPQKYAKGKTPTLYQGQGGDWRLTTTERKRILLNNIYGVDIDPQAVEVTKLSLLLKVLEGENEQTISRQLRMFHERALPDLGSNIKCGNSLIGPDFYEGRQLSFMDDDERLRINAFDWQREFPQVFPPSPHLRGEGRGGVGFDVVIGNPPYGMLDDDNAGPYYDRVFDSVEGRVDSFELFIERGLKLCRRTGLLGYIVPSPLLTNVYSRRLRHLILENSAIHRIVNFGYDVFKHPTVHTCIIILSSADPTNNLVSIRKQVMTPLDGIELIDYKISQTQLGQSENAVIDIFVDPQSQSVLQKLSKVGKRLGDLCYIRQCIKTGNDEEYVRAAEKPPGKPWKPSLRGKSIGRYQTSERNLYVKYGDWLARNWKNVSFYETPKIAIRETGNRIIATIDLDSRFFLSSLYAIYPMENHRSLDLKYLLGLLNSYLATYVIKKIAFDLTSGAFTKIRTNQLARLPIRTINFSDPADKARHDRMVALVEQMLDLNKKLAAVKVGHEKEALQRQIDATDKQIDELVYELYNITEQERRIVENQN
jgi:type I restriction-modification system DNA methylase subunit